MKTGLLHVGLLRQEQHSSSSVSGGENGFSVSLVGRRHHPEVAHLLERPRGPPGTPPPLGYPSGTGSGIVFRRRFLLVVMEDRLRHPLPHWILRRRGLGLLGPSPCLLPHSLPRYIHPHLPALLPLLHTFDEESSAFGANGTSRDLLAP